MKNTFKGLTVIWTVLVLCLSLAACTKPPAAPAGGAAAAPKENTPSIVLKLAHHTALDSAYDVSIKHFGKLVSDKTGGNLTVDVYPAAQLGGERDVLEGLKMGTIDMTLNTSALIMNLTPEFGLLDLPFLFQDYKSARASLDGPGGKILADKLLAEHGIRMLAGWNSGFRIMLTNSKPIEKLADFKGMKMRAPETPVYMDMFRALGANPTPIPYGEVYTALQLGVVEGVEVAPEPMYTSKFHEVGKYLVRTNHIFSAICPLINEEKYQSLPQAYKDAINSAMVESTDYEWDLFIKSDEKALQAMIDYGCKLNEIDRDSLREACKPMHAEYEKKYNATELLSLLK